MGNQNQTVQLSREKTEAVDRILSSAHGRGRNMLYEHEVYEILKITGANTPVYRLIRNESEITPEILSCYSSDRIVLKGAASDIAHKQKAGAVKILHKDLDFLKYNFTRMKTDLQTRGHKLEGILLVEFIDYSKELGNEIMLSFRESEAFGPVLSFTKGGSDAEHFARNFSSPNLVLAPIDRQWSEALFTSSRIHEKYIEEGKGDYVGKIISAGLGFSQLATSFSNFFRGSSEFILKEFEVNPFIFDPYGKFIALDGYATFAPRKRDSSMHAHSKPSASLTPFFHPDTIAIAGVSSTNTNSPGNIIASNLLRSDRKNIFCLNPRGGKLTVDGKQTTMYRSAVEIKADIDLAVIAVPAAQTLTVLEDLAGKNLKAAILIPGGFSETGQNFDLEDQLLALAEEKNIRLMGPNCLGIIYNGSGEHPDINTFFIPENKFSENTGTNRSVAVLSQSGALGLTEIHNLRHAISPRVIVSYGNQLDVDPSDLINYLGLDPDVDVIGCYIEGFKPGAGARFFRSGCRCPKPVIVYKAGRTMAGRMATESHTASIAGEYVVAKAAMKQAGLVVADTMIDHTEFIKTFALLNGFEVRGNRVAISANAGDETTYGSDNLRSLEVAEFSRKTQDKLRKILPHFVTIEPLLDLTPMADDAMYEKCIDTILADEKVDALMVSIVPHSAVIHTTDIEIAANAKNVAARIVELVHKHKKPVAVSVCVSPGADAVYNKLGQVLDQGGVPTFLTANRAMLCLNEFIRYHMIRQNGELREWLKED
jgi:acyl-CoA synthetase (NDP forming)